MFQHLRNIIEKHSDYLEGLKTIQDEGQPAKSASV